MATMPDGRIAGSFRDPGGFLFRRDGMLYRQVNHASAADLRLLHTSGLYDMLVDKGLLIPHAEAPNNLALTDDAACVIAPEPVPFISYPYEWCFSQLQDAALLTLRIQKLALRHGLTLKDASAYNVQFHQGRPVLIDTLSLSAYHEGTPWVAYRQFCQHFLAPLALMARVDVRLLDLMRVHLDGIPLDLASRLLPRRTRLSPGLLAHLHAHASSQRKHADRGAKSRVRKVSRNALQGIVSNLRNLIGGLSWQPAGTTWGNYYQQTNYSDAALQAKRDLVDGFLDQAAPGTVWDVGANDGTFSRLASARGIATVAADIDPAAVEQNWRQVKAAGEQHLLPLLMDLTNPSPAQGWDHAERASLLDRGPADCVLALALIHHLAIGNNVPLEQAASFLARAGRHLIIEFVPRSDSQVQRLLASREDIFTQYTHEGFEAAFATSFDTVAAADVAGSERRLYLMRRHDADAR
jgi:ribosomal protein L11 methylase PrmA